MTKPQDTATLAESQLPLQYQDGPDYCTVKDAQGRDFALTIQPELMKAMEGALQRDIAALRSHSTLEWQDISTAPKGIPILALEDFHREDDEGKKYPKDYQVVTKINGKWSSFGIYLESFEPTHWRPLPAAPGSDDSGGGVARADGVGEA